MLIKVIGFFVIAGTCTMVGMQISGELSGRVRILSDWVEALKLMQCDTGQLKMPMDSIFKELGARDGRLKEFFSNVRAGDEQCWKKQLSKIKYLTKKDISVLVRLSKSPAVNSDEQVKYIEYIKTLVEENLAEAKLAERRDGKVYRSVGFFAGIGLAALLV